MGVASGCGEQEVGVASGSGWNLWVWLLGVVVRRYIDFLILLIPTPLVSVLFCSSIPTFCSFKKMFFVLVDCTVCHVTGSTYLLVHSSPQILKMVALGGYSVGFELCANSLVICRSTHTLVGFYKKTA